MERNIIKIKVGPNNNWHILPAIITSTEDDGSVQAVYFEFMSDTPLADDFVKSSDGDYWVFKSSDINRPYVNYSPSLSEAANRLRSYMRSEERKDFNR